VGGALSRFAPAVLAGACALLAAGCGGAARVGESPASRTEWWGFTAPWDPASARTVRARAAALDAVVTGWITLDSATGMPYPLHPDTLRAMLPGTTRPMALVSTSEESRWRTDVVRRLGADRTQLARVAGALARHADSLGYRGLVLDFEQHTAGDLPALLAVLSAMRDSAAAHGVSPVVVAIPPEDTAAYPGAPLAAVADLLLVMLYDQHWTGSGPGPVSSLDWTSRWLAHRVREAGAERVVAGLPLYGYRWNERGEPVRSVGWADAVAAAERAGVPLERDAGSGSRRARVPGEWELWIPDAEQIEMLASRAASLGVMRIAFWRLGVEDPRLWPLLAR
jgi:spore germination protein YaaH